MSDWSAPPLAERRQQYDAEPFGPEDAAADPIEQFWIWYSECERAGVHEPPAMILSTVDANGWPDARVVLARAVDAEGIVFFTNYRSEKSRQLEYQHQAALTFAWLRANRQVRVRGTASKIETAISDDYFASRPRPSQIGAWASHQSAVIADRADLERAVDEYDQQFAGRDVERPDTWGGWRIQPTVWEFWQGRPNRLHDRVQYRDLDAVDGPVKVRLSP